MAISRPELAPARPAIHLAPDKGWMNDPNGLSLVDDLYHAYYQHNPDDDVWGPMHWRHATSSDLLHWTDHGIALAPTALGTIFSGSVVVDHENTSGFGPGVRVAVFTLAHDNQQRQGLAWSSDGHTWTMYSGNPVLSDPDEKDFRDPKVMRHGDAWVMALAVKSEIRFYNSRDLKRWEPIGCYTPSRPLGGTVECPDLMPLQTAAGEPAWVLTYCDDRGGPAGQSLTLGVAGQFDGTTFTEWSEPAPLDHGPDFYAAQGFHGLPADSPPVVLGWMNNWRYSNVHPSSGRRGVLSLPRTLHVASATDPLVRSHLAVSLDMAFPNPVTRPWRALPAKAVVIAGSSFEVSLRSEAGGELEVVIADGSARLERSDNGIDGFGCSIQVPADGAETIVVLDHGTVEVWTANGYTISALSFAGANWAVDTYGDASMRISA